MCRSRILTFILLSYGFSWAIRGRQVWAYQMGIDAEISPWNHIAGGLGPLFGALSTTLIFDKWRGLREFLASRLLRLPPPKWLIVGLGMPILFFAIPSIYEGLAGKGWPAFDRIGLNAKVPLQDTIAIWLMWCLFYGLGEEGGWRGFLFPMFCERNGARISTLYTALIWAPWHLPVFFYDKDFQAMGIGGTIGWVVGLVFGSLLLGWLVKQSRWSLWPVILWHGTFNLFTASNQLDAIYPAVMSSLVIVLSLWIARRYGRSLEWDRATL